MLIRQTSKSGRFPSTQGRAICKSVLWNLGATRGMFGHSHVVTTHADGFKSKLVKVDRLVLQIPTLTVHWWTETSTSRQLQARSRGTP
ncbi:hypothetical protein K438DRAFT_2114304 [Mycena galopus ATCC 62051]|nr:hypothetical protein K438DRAFT_2114304 [Mycena galopus ATCC 62051]